MPDQDFTLVKEILAANDCSWTKSREIVFRSISSTSPQTISEIIKKCQGRVDRVTVYRNIELFENLGIVHRINIGWKYKLELSDQFVAHHHHLSCIKCGRIIDIEDELHIDKFINEVAAKFSFKAKSHQFEIEGLCKNCQTKQSLASV